MDYQGVKFGVQLISSLFPEAQLNTCCTGFTNATFAPPPGISASDWQEELNNYQWINDNLNVIVYSNENNVEMVAIEESESLANWRFLEQLEISTSSTLNDFYCQRSNTQEYRPLKFALQLILSIFPDIFIESCSSDFSNCLLFVKTKLASQIAEEILCYQWLCDHLDLLILDEGSLAIADSAYIRGFSSAHP